MEQIIQYNLEDNGTYTAVVQGLILGNDETMLIDNGLGTTVDVSIHNSYQISGKQRRKIFALVSVIEAHTGEPCEYMRRMFQYYLKFIYGYQHSTSLSDCSKQTANEVIEVILQWVFLHDIPLNYRTSDLMKEDNRFKYLSTVHRTCVICGEKNADLAHRYAVGNGRDRTKIHH